MTILGAIFAGGAARRFGSDKALADIDGEAMLDRIASRLRCQVDALAVVGRDWRDLPRIDDRPVTGLGPLGALAGALAYAAEAGHASVLTSGCDLPDVPLDLVMRLAPGPAVMAGQPLLGLWPATLASTLLDYLAGNDDRAMRGWIAHSRARRVQPTAEIANINTRDDLAAWQAARAVRPVDPPPSR